MPGMKLTELSARRIRVRLAEVGASQETIAQLLQMHPSVFSRILHRRQHAPGDFIARFDLAMEKYSSAERAAAAARDRVLAG